MTFLERECHLSSKNVDYDCLRAISPFDDVSAMLMDVLERAEDNGDIRNLNREHVWAIACVILVVHKQRLKRRADDSWHPFIWWGEFHRAMEGAIRTILTYFTDIGIIKISHQGDHRKTLFGSHEVPTDLPYLIEQARDAQARQDMEDDEDEEEEEETLVRPEQEVDEVSQD